jgi:Cu2+-exporting ATPase
MIQNLDWTNAIPLAAGVLSRFGILLSPTLGVVLMSVSTVIVAINAQIIKVID